MKKASLGARPLSLWVSPNRSPFLEIWYRHKFYNDTDDPEDDPHNDELSSA